jgi:hypothetical protein
MKTLIFALCVLSSSLSFAQSFLHQKNGQILTINKNGELLELGNFLIPYSIDETGGRYFTDKERKVQTIDANGYLYSKADQDKVPAKIEIHGGNYFISKRGTLYTVSSEGYFFENKKEREFRNVTVTGGNFFVSERKKEGKKSKVLFTVNKAGTLSELKVPNFDVGSIHTSVGGQFFTTTRGELFSVSVDGFVFSKKELGLFRGWEFKSGGNFFFYQKYLYTVTDAGVVLKQNLADSYGKTYTIGSNFFVTQDKKLFTVSADGQVKQVASDFEISDISHFSRL